MLKLFWLNHVQELEVQLNVGSFDVCGLAVVFLANCGVNDLPFSIKSYRRLITLDLRQCMSRLCEKVKCFLVKTYHMMVLAGNITAKDKRIVKIVDYVLRELALTQIYPIRVSLFSCMAHMQPAFRNLFLLSTTDCLSLCLALFPSLFFLAWLPASIQKRIFV